MNFADRKTSVAENSLFNQPDRRTGVVVQRTRDDDGAVAILFALLAVVLFGFGALAVDAGYGWAAKRQLSVTADASSLAGAQAAVSEVRQGGSSSSACIASDSAAGDIYANNADDWGELGAWPAWSWSPSAANPYTAVASRLCDVSGSAVTVTVPLQRELEVTLGGVAGASKLEPGAVSTARALVPDQYGGLRPFGMCQGDVNQVLAAQAAGEPVTTRVTIFEGPSGGGSEEASPCSDASGAWGGVNLDRRDPPTCPSAGGNTFRDWIDNGYAGGISFPTDFCGHEGAQFTNPSFLNGLDPLIDAGTTIVLPVVETDSWSGTGGGSFHSPHLFPVKLCGYVKGNGHGNTSGACWNPDLVPEDLDASSMVLQWVYDPHYVTDITSTPGGGFDESCPIADPRCIPALLLWE